VSRNRILTDTVSGAAFGLLFPMAASLLEIIIIKAPFSPAGFLFVQGQNPLLWIIDSAPFFLGLLGYMVGTRAARIEDMKAALEQESRERGQMVEQLQTRRGDLEQKVSQQVNKLKAAAQVGRAAASIHDQPQLFSEVTDLISSQFGYYHIGIFVLDEAGEFAILQAANSQGGKRMLARGYKLAVGKEGNVGEAAMSGEPRITLDVGDNPALFNNPELPDTRSEIALAMKANREIIGVLDIQSTKPSDFTNEDVEVLQLIADQVALAIQNARLLIESQQAMQELVTLSKEQVHQDWTKKLSYQTLAYQYSRLGAAPVSSVQIDTILEREAANQFQIPILLRGEQLGVIILRRDEDQPAWTPDERSLAQAAAGQVASALENARLFEEAQRRASREQALSRLTAQFTRSVNFETLLKKAVQELSHLPNVAEVSIEIGPPQNGS
jgi:GAF domain-containing protein